MKTFIIRLTDWIAYAAIAAVTAYAYSMGAYYTGYENNPLYGILYGAIGFSLASMVSAVWFCLSGAYAALQSLETEAIRARVRETMK